MITGVIPFRKHKPGHPLPRYTNMHLGAAAVVIPHRIRTAVVVTRQKLFSADPCSLLDQVQDGHCTNFDFLPYNDLF